MLAIFFGDQNPDSAVGHDDGNAWTLIQSGATPAGTFVAAYGAHTGSSPSAGTVTVSRAADTLAGVFVVEIPGLDVSGTVLDSLLDYDLGASASGTTLSTPALSATTDLTMGAFVNTNAQAITVENTELDTATWGPGIAVVDVDYNITGDTTHTATISVSSDWGAMAFSFNPAAIADTTLAFSNVTVTGSVYNDSASNTLTINATNGSSLTAGDPGTGDGQT
ncbi:MAG: hypothetical protein GY746_01160, partial [Gammaproteobacteria bacterium]|nr:hypothetical protein [Gammaproteobacteria bacterium]